MTAGALGQPKTFEWWMLSMFAIGISYSAFVSLLIPPYFTETEGDASTAGIVVVGGIAGMALSFAASDQQRATPEPVHGSNHGQLWRR